MLKRLLIQGKRSQDRAWGEDLISCYIRMRCAICPLHADARRHMLVSGDRWAGSLEGIYWKNFPNMEKSGNRALSPVGGPPCSHRLFAIDKCSHKKRCSRFGEHRGWSGLHSHEVSLALFFNSLNEICFLQLSDQCRHSLI